MSVLSKVDRLNLRQLYVFRCGYCGISETDVGSELTEDHFQPVSSGGTDEFANIVYACHTCNSFKGAVWNPASSNRVLHPLRESVSLHIEEQTSGVLVALTQTGGYHIARLFLNRPGLVAHRQERGGIAGIMRAIRAMA